MDIWQRLILLMELNMMFIFGETKNGVWIAKEPNVTYGTNGFRLQFKEVGGSANSSGIGADTSGNRNYFSISGFTAYDSVWKDSPENNFSVMTDLSFLQLLILC